MKKKLKDLYLSAAYLLTDPYILSEMEEYPQAHIMAAARRGLKLACLNFDPVRGASFVRYAEYRIHHSIHRCIAEEVPESRLLAQCSKRPASAQKIAELIKRKQEKRG